jgi:hypothetical protein
MKETPRIPIVLSRYTNLGVAAARGSIPKLALGRRGTGEKMTEPLLLIFIGALVLLVSQVLFRSKKSAAPSRKGPL